MGKRKSSTKASAWTEVGSTSKSLEEALRNSILQARIDLATGRPSRFTDLYSRLSGQFDTELKRLLGLIPSESDIANRRLQDDLVSGLVGRGAVSSGMASDALARLQDYAIDRRARLLPILSSQAYQNVAGFNPELATGRYLAGVTPEELAAYSAKIQKQTTTQKPSLLDMYTQYSNANAQLLAGLTGGSPQSYDPFASMGSQQAIQDYYGSPKQSIYSESYKPFQLFGTSDKYPSKDSYFGSSLFQ